MVSFSVALVAVAFICTVASATGRCPVWVPVLLIVLAVALQFFPR